MNQTDRHTPGPWKVRFIHNGAPYQIEAPNGDDRKSGAVGKRVTRWGCFMLPTSAEAVANAHLIAAAPDLLQALTGLLEETEGNGCVWERKARAALSRARGKESGS